MILAISLYNAPAAHAQAEPELSAKDRPIFKKQKIRIKDKTIEVEMAENDKQRSFGLMFQTKLASNHGMLFVFAQEQSLNFWMKNTFMDLSIGYFDRTKTLVDIQEMTGQKSIMNQNLSSYPSARPAMYALEMAPNWFTQNKIKVGDKFESIKK